MGKKVDLGLTPFNDLYKILDFEEREELDKKKARLFPSGKKTQDEIATTSIFLASLGAVKEYREELLTEIGINKINKKNVTLHIYTEIRDEDGNRPDGMIVLTSGKNNPIVEWIAFVEAKVGSRQLVSEQIKSYADFAKSKGINSIVTISNNLVTTPLESPEGIETIRNFHLFHWSWPYLSVTANRLLKNEKIEDEDHIFILTELRRFFESHTNLSHFTYMDSKWKDATNKLKDNDFNNDQSIIDTIVRAYQQEEKDISLHLTDTNSEGHYVRLKTAPKEARKERLKSMLTSDKTITSEYYINGNIKKTFSLTIDFKGLIAACSTKVEFSTGKAQAKTTALITLLSEAGKTDDIFIRAIYLRKKASEFKSLEELIKEKEKKLPYSIVNKEFGDDVREFEIKIAKDMSKPDFHSPNRVIVILEELTKAFFEQVFIKV